MMLNYGVLTPPDTPSYARWILFYLVLCAAVYGALYQLGWVTRLPGADNLMIGDARFYHSIGREGYVYEPGVPCNAGFFPLFGYLWGLTGLGVVGISVVNGIVFNLAVWINCRLLRPHPIVLGFFLSLPFLCYIYTPHSEAFFFLFATGVIWSFARRQFSLLTVCLLLAGLTRPTVMFLFPALVGATLMEGSVKRALSLPNLKTILLWFLPPLVLTLGIVAWIQYVQVGDAGAYYKVQAEIWGREFGWPVFPLAGKADSWLQRWRIFNYCVGMLAAGMGLRYLIQWLRDRGLPAGLGRKELLSVIYLTMGLLSIVFFNPEWHWIPAKEYSSTVLNGINRYIQVNPFMLVFLAYLFGSTPRSARWLAPLVIALHIVYLPAWPDYWDHIRRFGALSVVTGMLGAYALYYFVRREAVGYALIVAAYAFQAYMYSVLLSGTPID